MKIVFVDEETLGFTVADSYGEQIGGSAADALEVDVDGRELVFSGFAELQGKLTKLGTIQSFQDLAPEPILGSDLDCLCILL